MLLGGNFMKVKFLLNGDDPQEKIDTLIDKVTHHPKIHIYTNSQIVKIDGSVGNFSTEFKSDDQVHTVNHGVVIVATGAKDYNPTEYLYGQDKKVITQTELEEKLANGFLQTTNHTPQTAVMIQCVGSRDEKQPYCSRICCQQAIKNALLIKEKSPDTQCVYPLPGYTNIWIQ